MPASLRIEKSSEAMDSYVEKDSVSSMSDIYLDPKPKSNGPRQKNTLKPRWWKAMTESKRVDRRPSAFLTTILRDRCGDSEEHITAIVPYQGDKKPLAGQEAQRGTTPTRIWASFLAYTPSFFVLYFFVFAIIIDGVYLLAWLAELVGLLVVSLLLKGNNPLVLALGWAFYALSVFLTLFFPKKKDESKKEEEAHA